MSQLKTLNRQTTNLQSILPERVVQFGAGNFIRAFVDWMIQRLNEETDFSSSVVVVKVTPNSKYDDLDAQDGLFYVHTEGIKNGEFITQTQRIDCISRTVYPYYNFDAYRALARQPQIRFLVSNTTEAGISYNANDQFADTPASSFPAKLTQFLYERYRHFEGASHKGCIILPTELVVDNGTQLRHMVLAYAKQWQLDSEFTDWITQHNHFYNTLVDRIVSGYPADKHDEILQKVGYNDDLLVMGEHYHSWVIEAPQSILTALPFDQSQLNVKIVDDVDPYRRIKVRILNGLHTTMVPIGYLMGLETVQESIEHPLLGQFLRDEATQEIIPSLDMPEDELRQFASDVFDRFRNPSVHHRLLSIAVNTSTKVKTRILPTIRTYHHQYNQLPQRAVLAMAAFIRFYKGEWQGDPIPLVDDENVIAWFKQQWQTCESHAVLVQRVLENTDLWDSDLSEITGLHAQLEAYLTQIDTSGIENILENLNTA
ncbi:MAG: tagaturonate reductase [Anaerolineae bacterium]